MLLRVKIRHLSACSRMDQSFLSFSTAPINEEIVASKQRPVGS